MKLLFSLIVFSLAACTTVAQRPTPVGMSEAPTTPGTRTITGDELKQTGRTDLSDALRASSPIFQ